MGLRFNWLSVLGSPRKGTRYGEGVDTALSKGIWRTGMSCSQVARTCGLQFQTLQPVPKENRTRSLVEIVDGCRYYVCFQWILLWSCTFGVFFLLMSGRYG